jgi:membrane-associated phospholipid phosphatase
MLIATPLGGGHYFVDLIAGVLVAAAAIRAALAISRLPPPASVGTAENAEIRSAV